MRGATLLLSPWTVKACTGTVLRSHTKAKKAIKYWYHWYVSLMLQEKCTQEKFEHTAICKTACI